MGNKISTSDFVDYFKGTIKDEGQHLIIDFFIVFSRMECALKTAGFINNSDGKVQPNWDSYIAEIRHNFDPERTDELKKAVKYLTESPPRIQSISNDLLSWKDREFQAGVPLINKLNISIRDIRNNLFHGGKFNGRYQKDVSRNYILLYHSIIILNEWLILNQKVKENFFNELT